MDEIGFGLGAALLLAGAAWAAGAVQGSGAAAGFAVAGAVVLGTGVKGLALLGAFVAAGTAATRLGYEAKARSARAEPFGGRRGWRQVLATGTPAALCSLGALAWPDPRWAVALAGSLAVAASDTLSSEIGMLSRGAPRDLLTLRILRPGEDGGVSLLGLAAGASGAALLGALSFALGLTDRPRAFVVVAAGFSGNLLDSLLGATAQRKGWTGNSGVNFLATAFGAAAAAFGVR